MARKMWVCLGSLWVLMFCLWWYTTAQEKPLRVEWLGWPLFAKPYSGIDPGFYGDNPPPDILVDKNKELGLREDGICVCRPRMQRDDPH